MIKEYLMTVASASCAGIVADILNDALCTRGKGIEKFIKFGITVCIACVIVIPLTDIAENVQDAEMIHIGEYRMDSYDTETDSLYILEMECAQRLGERIAELTDVITEDISIEMAMTDSGAPVITDAEITISTDDAENAERIKQISHEALGTEARVLIKEKYEEAD